MLILVAFGILTVAQSGNNFSEITGSVTYRERIALSKTAELIVSLDQINGSKQRSISELKVALQGSQVPFVFTLPYAKAALKPGAIFAVRAKIIENGIVLFETARSSSVITNNVTLVNLSLVRAAKMETTLTDLKWELYSLTGKKLLSESPAPWVIFSSKKGQLRGFTGVNSMGGNYTLDAMNLKVELGAMTMRAASPALMLTERRFVDVLAKARKAILFEGDLVLYDGERELARFVKSKNPSAQD